MLSAENLRTGNIWRWFMTNAEIPRALDLCRFRRDYDGKAEAARRELMRQFISVNRK